MFNLRAPYTAGYGTKPATHSDTWTVLASAVKTLATVHSPDGSAVCFHAGAPPDDASSAHILPLKALAAKTHVRGVATARWQSGLSASTAIAAMHCFEQTAFAMAAVPLIALLTSEIALDPSPAHTHVAVSHDGLLNHVWCQSAGRVGNLQTCCLWLGRRIAAELVRFLPTFAALTASDAHSLARRASHVISGIAGIGLTAGLRVSDVQARYIAGLVLAAGSPVLRPAGADAHPACRTCDDSPRPANS